MSNVNPQIDDDGGAAPHLEVVPTTPEVDPRLVGDPEVELFRQLAEARKNKTAWEKIEKDARNSIVALFEARNTSEVITASGAKVGHITTSPRESVDSKKLKALYPQVYAEVAVETETRTVKVDLPAED